MPKNARIMVVCDIEEKLTPMFQRRFPGIPIRFVTQENALKAILESFKPTVVLAFPGEPIDKSAFPAILNGASVEWLSNGGAGVEHLGPWNPEEKTVTNASGVNAKFLAQYTIAAHMSANMDMPKYAKMQRDRIWKRLEWEPFDGRRFCIVGLGNVGRAVAALAKPLGLEVVGTRGTAKPTDNVDEVFAAADLHKALDGADFVSVHTAQTPETIGLFNDKAFAAMKDGVIFLNASRGPVVNEEALLRALNSGKISTAILDVFETEPLPRNSPLWEHENVIVTPHMADSIAGWDINMTRAFCDNLDRWLKDEPLQNIVDPTLGY